MLPVSLNCIHSTVYRHTNEYDKYCETYGVPEDGYNNNDQPIGYASINKQKLYSHAYNYMHIPAPKGIKGNAKLYHISFLSKFAWRNLIKEKNLAEELNGVLYGNLRIRHLCGCKLCVQRLHLTSGTQEQNKSDEHYQVMALFK